MTQAVKRACDACHRRKVKCDGINPCRNCSSAQLSCTYNAIPQKKGPKGSRAKVISELRETQRQTSLSAKVQNRMNGIASPPGTPGLTPTPGLLTPEMMKDCVEFFFANMYDKMPFLERRHIDHSMHLVEQNREAYCLLTSLCAFVMLQPGMTMPAGDPYNLDMLPGANIVSSTLLLEEALRVRKGYDYFDNPSLHTLATSYFISACYQGIELHDKAWFYLRDATTMMHMAGMTKEENYLQWDGVESSRRRRLYWLFYMTERSHALQRHRPLTLQATVNPPTLADDPTDPLAHQLNNFVLMVNLFRSFDDGLTAVWNKTRSNLTAPFITSLQKQLHEAVQSYMCQDSQFADLRTNQQWLKHTSWQLTNGSLNSDDGMNFQYPAELSRELLLNLASQFPGQGIDFIGSGMIEKLLEVTCSMMDFLSIQPASRDPFTAGPREHLNQLVEVVAAARSNDTRFLPLLLSKVHEVLPRLTNPMLQHVPENCGMANIDIFDGFGNAGMAQPPPQMQMQMDADYDRKFSVSDYEKKYSMSDMGSSSDGGNASAGTQSLPPAAADMSSPFVSSPAMLSPPMEFPTHGLTDFNSMSDMVMSPMGGPSNGMGGLQMNAQHSQHTQHQPHHILQSQPLAPQQMPQGMNQHHGHHGMTPSAIPTSHPMAQQAPTLMSPMPRQTPQRANSFAIAQQPQIRTVGDFHALQRANSDTLNTLSGMAGMGPGEMDFNTLH